MRDAMTAASDFLRCSWLAAYCVIGLSLIIVTNSAETTSVVPSNFNKSESVAVPHSNKTHCPSPRNQIPDADEELKHLLCLTFNLLHTLSDSINNKQAGNQDSNTNETAEHDTLLPSVLDKPTLKRLTREVSVSVQWGVEGSGVDANNGTNAMNETVAILDLRIEKTNSSEHGKQHSGERHVAEHSGKHRTRNRWAAFNTAMETKKANNNAAAHAGSDKRKLPPPPNYEIGLRRSSDSDYYDYQDYGDFDYPLRSNKDSPTRNNRYHGYRYNNPHDRYERYGYRRPVYPYDRLPDAGYRTSPANDDSSVRQGYYQPMPGTPPYPAINPYNFYNPFFNLYLNPWSMAPLRNDQSLPFGQPPTNVGDIRNGHISPPFGYHVQSRYNDQEQQVTNPPHHAGPTPAGNHYNSPPPAEEVGYNNDDYQSNQPATAAPGNFAPDNPHQYTTPAFNCQTDTERRPADPYEHLRPQDNEQQPHYSNDDRAPGHDHGDHYQQDSGSEHHHAENDHGRPGHEQESYENNDSSGGEYEQQNNFNDNRRPPQEYNPTPVPGGTMQPPPYPNQGPQHPMRGPNTYYGYPQQGYRPGGYYGFMYDMKGGGIASIAIIISFVLFIAFLILLSAGLTSGRSIRTGLLNSNTLKYDSSSITGAGNAPWNWTSTTSEHAEAAINDYHLNQHHICAIVEAVCFALRQSQKTAAVPEVFHLFHASLNDGPFHYSGVELVGGLIRSYAIAECPHLVSLC